MSDIQKYAQSVKDVKRKNVITLLATTRVAATDLIDNINRLQNEGISLTDLSRSWAVTKSITNNVSKGTPGYRAETPTLDMIRMGADVVTALVDYLEKAVKGYREEIWAGESISVRQVYILSTIEQLDFWTRYSGKLIDILLSMSSDSTYNMDRHLTKNELMFVNGSGQYFSNITVSLLKGRNALIKEIQDIPELAADDEASQEILLGMGGKRPELSRGFGIHLVNPKYWYDSVMMDINLWRIRSTQDQNEYLAMKINQAINQKNGATDASLDHRIETYRSKIIKNTATINSIVESYQ